MSVLRSVVLFFVVIALTACSQLTGNEGNLQFQYPADDRLLDFNKPIAVGGRLEVEVKEVGSGRVVDLVSVQSDDPEVLAVSSFSGNRFILEGTGAGSALISVEATVPAGTTVTDSVNMLARVPEVLKLGHTCTVASTARYLVGHDVVVGYELEMPNSQPVIGYGYHPLDWTPPEALTLDATSRDQQWLHFNTQATPATVTLSSQIDDTTAVMELVTAASIDGAVLGPFSGLGWTEVGKNRFYHVLPTVGGDPICQAVSSMTAVSDTPGICTVSPASIPDNPPEEITNEWGWMLVTGVAEGTCTITVGFAEGNAGAGASSQVSVEIRP